MIIHSFFRRSSALLLPIAERLYRYPTLCGVLLTVLSSMYLIYDYGVVNDSALVMLWELNQPIPQAYDALAWVIHLLMFTGLSAENAAYALMIACHAGISLFLLLIAKRLFFAKMTRWALVFLLLCHPVYNDFRSYIIAEPLFWVLWLGALSGLLRYYRDHIVWVILGWFVLLLAATQFAVSAWFWLLLFPFGVVLWRPWRSKSVAYGLLGYASIVVVLLFLPVYQGVSPMEWIQSTIIENPNSISDVLGVKESNWVRQENTLMAWAFVFSGATSLVLIRTAISSGVLCIGLAVYAIMKKQYRIAEDMRRMILIYMIGFDVFITVLLLVLNKDQGSLVSFSITFLLLLLSALGLSYVFRKIANDRYSKLSVLVIVWCLVAYFASGFIIFGPRQGYLREAGEFATQFDDMPMYSNDSNFLYYANRDPSRHKEWSYIQQRIGNESFYVGYAQHRSSDLPALLAAKTPMFSFKNKRGNKLILFRFLINQE